MEVSISMPGDLHNHSTCSDGSVPIHRLPLMAARAGLDTMAISDHDTLLSVNYCYEHPVQDGVHLLPAAELTGYDHEHRHRVHLLCYYPDPESRELREHCDILRQRRNECKAQRRSKRCTRSSARNRHWNTQKTAVYCSKAALWRRCISWACAMPYMAGCTVTFLAGSRAAWCCTR